MNRSALWVGAGCLGCIGVPSLLAIGGAGGYFFATQQRESVALVERVPSERIAVAPVPEREDAWETRSLRAREEAPVPATARPVVEEDDAIAAAVIAKPAVTPMAREIVVATPAPTPTPALARIAAPISTPVAKPVVAKPEVAKLAAPIATPVAKELAKISAPISTPAPAAVKALKAPVVEAVKAAPIPKSTPRNFDEPEFGKSAKSSKVASAAGSAAPAVTAEDVAVADLFGDAPGGSAPAAVPAAAPPASAPAASSAKVRTIKTKGGPVQVTIGSKIAIQGADKKAVLGTLEKVEGGWVAVRTGDGKVKMIAESDVVDASEL